MATDDTQQPALSDTVSPSDQANAPTNACAVTDHDVEVIWENSRRRASYEFLERRKSK
jgi:hypothetical protein